MQRPAKRMRPLFRVNVRRAVEMRWTIQDKMSSPYPQFSCTERRLHLQTVCVSKVKHDGIMKRPAHEDDEVEDWIFGAIHKASRPISPRSASAVLVVPQEKKMGAARLLHSIAPCLLHAIISPLSFSPLSLSLSLSTTNHEPISNLDHQTSNITTDRQAKRRNQIGRNLRRAAIWLMPDHGWNISLVLTWMGGNLQIDFGNHREAERKPCVFRLTK